MIKNNYLYNEMIKPLKIVIAFAILLSFHTLAFSRSPEYEWTTQDTVLQSAFTTLACIDLWQTYTFLYIDKDGKESNPFMGEHPSKQRFFVIGGGWIVLHSAISYIIPKQFRTIWQSIWISEEIYCIHNNYTLGVQLKF